MGVKVLGVDSKAHRVIVDISVQDFYDLQVASNLHGDELAVGENNILGRTFLPDVIRLKHNTLLELSGVRDRMVDVIKRWEAAQQTIDAVLAVTAMKVKKIKGE